LDESDYALRHTEYKEPTRLYPVYDEIYGIGQRVIRRHFDHWYLATPYPIQEGNLSAVLVRWPNGPDGEFDLEPKHLSASKIIHCYLTPHS
jgi:hypothetical protein